MNSSNHSLLAAIIKPDAHCLDSLAPQLSLPTLINYVSAYLRPGLFGEHCHVVSSLCKWQEQGCVRVCVCVCLCVWVSTGGIITVIRETLIDVSTATTLRWDKRLKCLHRGYVCVMFVCVCVTERESLCLGCHTVAVTVESSPNWINLCHSDAN